MPFGDWNLLRRLRAGDRDAYVQVAERYHKEIWAYVYRLCGDRETASDICQEVAVRVWQSAPEFRGVNALRAWIYRVAHNAFVDHCRRNDSRSLSLLREPADGIGCDIAQAVADRSSVRTALDSLPVEIREAVSLTKVQGLTCAEAAEVLEAPIGTVKWWVSQGIKQLREELTEDGEQS